MYHLLEIRGTDPERKVLLAESEDADELSAEQQTLEREALTAGYTLTELRYAVRAV